jgi:5'-methylthioadenosine phosphorylase
MKTKETIKIAVIGGSGLYTMKDMEKVGEVRIKTPFGNPSDAIVVGILSGVRCAFLPRHGRNHTLLPGEINGRANLWALKSLGVERIIALAAVGSLKEELPPRHIVFPDQLADETKGRPSTFFGDGIVAHVAFARPFCDATSDVLYETSQKLGFPSHRGGTYACMEGPTFSTKAESLMHRQLGYSLIGMTAVPEAKLAREAEICYAPISMVTDYDCWKEGEEVSLEQVVANLSANATNAQAILREAVPRLAAMPRACRCATALRDAIVTQPKAMNKATWKKLRLLLDRYVPL